MDDEDFRRFVVARRTALLRTAWLLTGEAEDAEDLVQVALERTARHWRRVSASGDPEAYVRRALHNAHVSAWRRTCSRVRELLGHDAVEPAGVDRTEQNDTTVVLRQALARLTPKQRTVLVLRYYEDLTEPQVAAVMGVGVGTVKSQVRHALGRGRGQVMMDTLRERLDELAHRSPAARMPHDAAADRAWRRGRRILPATPVMAGVLVGSLVLLLGIVGALAVSRRTQVVPAHGAAAVPARIVVPPAGTPLVTEQPVDRAAYLIAAGDLRRGTFSRGIAPVVVSADGGQYRVVPWHDGDHGISLSPDGRRLAWIQDEMPTATRTVVLTLSTGELREVPDAPTAAEGTAWSDDGSRLLVWGAVSENEAENSHVEVRDAVTLRVLSKESDRSGPAALVAGRLVVPAEAWSTNVSVVSTDRAVVSPPDGRRAAQVVMTEADDRTRSEVRLVVHPVDGPAESFTPVLLRGVAYAEALAWTPEGLVVAKYAGAELHGPAEVAVLDPATGRVVRVLTALPDDAEPDLVVDVQPQVVAVATDVLATGRVADSRPRTWPWHSVERVRWWVSAPVTAGVQVGLPVLVLLIGLGLVRMARRS